MTDHSAQLTLELCKDDSGAESIALLTLNRPDIKNAISDGEVIDAIEQTLA